MKYLEVLPNWNPITDTFTSKWTSSNSEVPNAVEKRQAIKTRRCANQ